MEVTAASNELEDGVDVEKALSKCPVVIVPPSFCGVCGSKGGSMFERKVKECRVYTRTGICSGRLYFYGCSDPECNAICGSSMCTMPGKVK